MAHFVHRLVCAHTILETLAPDLELLPEGQTVNLCLPSPIVAPSTMPR